MVVVLELGIQQDNQLLALLNKLDCPFKLSKSEQDILSADKLILCVENDLQSILRNLHVYNLFSVLRLIKKPILTIGSGVQLLYDRLLDNGSAGLGIVSLPDNIDSSIHLTDFECNLNVKVLKKERLFDGFGDTTQFYFNKVTYIPSTDDTTAVVEKKHECCVAIEKSNFYGVQFHPELSGDSGERLIKNFLEKC
jgi:glutamine amidotransferase